MYVCASLFPVQGVSKMQMQMPFQFPDGRPKQKRHRCRNPNKIDVNSLTGEERVQIINRRNARKVGAHRRKCFIKYQYNEVMFGRNDGLKCIIKGLAILYLCIH